MQTRIATRFPIGSRSVMEGSPMTPFSLEEKWGDPTPCPYCLQVPIISFNSKRGALPPIRGHLPTGFGSHWATPTCSGCFHQQLYLSHPPHYLNMLMVFCVLKQSFLIICFFNSCTNPFIPFKTKLGEILCMVLHPILSLNLLI